MRMEGYIVFGADPIGVGVGIGVGVHFFVSVHYLAFIHCWEEGKSRLDFGDLDLIFKVTGALRNVQNMVSVRYLLN